MVISIDSEKIFDRIKYAFILKVLKEPGMEGAFLNIIKVVYGKTTVISVLMGEISEHLP